MGEGGASPRPAPRLVGSSYYVVRMPGERGFKQLLACVDGSWWGPYVGVLLAGVLAGLFVLVFVVLNAAEILRALRASGI